jgi:hypothetical protein
MQFKNVWEWNYVPQGVELRSTGSGITFHREWNYVPQEVELRSTGSGITFHREWTYVPIIII